MSTEIVRSDQMASQIEFAKTLAAANMLPDAYRNQPANVLVAMGLGQAMGLSPAESMYRINVIKGKPSASAELIAANVRRAGHKLRVSVSEQPPAATCTIVRADDPDHPTTVTRDMDWAQRMGLASEPNYRKQPATMLSWRAISACARLACPEALYGVVYTPDELDEIPTTPVVPAATTGGVSRVDQIINPAGDSTVTVAEGTTFNDDVVDGEIVPESPKRALWERMRTLPKDAAKAFLDSAVGHDLARAMDITDDEAAEVLANYDALLAAFMQEES